MPLPKEPPLANERGWEDEEEEDSEEEVLLGFTQAAPRPCALTRHSFPSKVGGVPAWLDPQDLPRGEQSRCSFCKKPLTFLLQAYAPVEGIESSFHRIVFLFTCRNSSCLVLHQKEQQEEPGGSNTRRASVRAFRCQLQRNNKFYAYDPLPQGSPPPPPPKGGGPAPLCHWCGTWRAEKRCGGCQQANYCSREHQVDHWKRGHAAICRNLRAAKSGPTQPSVASTEPPQSIGTSAALQDESETSVNETTVDASVHDPRKETTLRVESTGESEVAAVGESEAGPSGSTAASSASQLVTEPLQACSPDLFPELELVVEPEPEEEEERFGEEKAGQGPSQRVRELLAEYEERAKENEYSTSELLEAEQVLSENISVEKQQWADFEARIAIAPEQVLRYCRSATARPLWPSPSGQPKQEGSLLPCQNCGAKRIFEFQVLPQLLYYLKVDSSDPAALDFGTLAVYTCGNSCAPPARSEDKSASTAYREELVWVQTAV